VAEARMGADDEHDAAGEPNGRSATVDMALPLESRTSDEAEREAEEQEESEEQESDAAAPESAPQNRLIPGANSGVVAPTARLETAQVRHTSVPMVAVPVVAVPVAAPLAGPSPKGIAAQDLDRLKHALAELEACRRMLDKVNEGGR
jgi:hypothetical protein